MDICYADAVREKIFYYLMMNDKLEVYIINNHLKLDY